MSGSAFDLRGKRVWVAGHRGMVGSAIVRRLAQEQCEVLTVTRSEVDLRNSDKVGSWVDRTRPDAVFMAAATVGGILANDTRPAEFLFDNLAIATSVVEACHRSGIAKLLFLGSSCIYPKLAPQPIEESALLTGALEPTNEWYAVAKIAGVKLCQAYRKQYGRDFISALPANLYGPGDNFDLASSHVIPALLRKMHIAKMERSPDVVVWGTGTPRREFLHVDDCADALVHIMKVYSGAEHINVGSGSDLTILELAHAVAEVVGFDGRIVQDLSKPDGTPGKLMSAAKIKALGWAPKISLKEGLRDTYRWLQAHLDQPDLR